ncbi:MAG: hypothetical protein FWG19_03790 [Methanomassiliicoccaceae archaeon]|nr:hypothetical protein [Methanomassiliicoccaceae archaeon]
MAETETVHDPHAETKKNITWAEFIGIERYAYQIYRLQNEAGLSFKEARVVLTPPPMIKALAKEWGCSYENVCNLGRRGRQKVNRKTEGDRDKIEDLIPTKMSFAD